MTPTTTLESQGARTINVRSSSGSTLRLTPAVFVTAAGNVLTPYIVYKGKSNGRIARDFLAPEAHGYPSDCFYSCQERAWMDEKCCLQWVEKCVKPWSEKAPPGVLPLLLLDQYKCHLQTAVVNAIHDLGVEIEYIPGGCTSLTQPVDVGINKPLKNRVRAQWEEYMLEDGLFQEQTKPPSCQQMAQWCVKALKDLPKEIVKNSWRHGDYSYFPGEVRSTVVDVISDSMEELDLSNSEDEETTENDTTEN